jgi:hypothetical protein
MFNGGDADEKRTIGQFSSDGRYFVSYSYYSNTCLVFDWNTKSTVYSSTGMISVTMIDSNYYIAKFSGSTISVLSLSGTSLFNITSTISSNSNSSLVFNNKLIFVSNGTTMEVYSINLTTNSAEKIGTGVLQTSFTSNTIGIINRLDFSDSVWSYYYMSGISDYGANNKLLTELTVGISTLYNPIAVSAESEDILSTKTAIISSGSTIGTMPNNGALTYTPSTSQQSIPLGYTSGGTIAAISSTIEPNLVTQNIIYGKSIFGVTGSAINNEASITTELIPLDGAVGLSIKLKDTTGTELIPVNNIYTTTTRPTTIEIYQFETKVDETTYDITTDGLLSVSIGNYAVSAYDDYANENINLVNGGISTTSSTSGSLTFEEKDGSKVLYTPSDGYVQYTFDSMSMYTIEFDFFKSGTAAYSRGIGAIGANYELEIKGASNTIYWGESINAGWVQDAWNKIKLVKASANSSSVQLYVNNVLKATRSYSNALTGIYLGRGNSGSNYFTGWYRNVKIYTMTSTPSSPLEVTFTETSISQQDYQQALEQIDDLFGEEVSL